MSDKYHNDKYPVKTALKDILLDTLYSWAVGNYSPSVTYSTIR